MRDGRGQSSHLSQEVVSLDRPSWFIDADLLRLRVLGARPLPNHHPQLQAACFGLKRVDIEGCAAAPSLARKSRLSSSLAEFPLFEESNAAGTPRRAPRWSAAAHQRLAEPPGAARCHLGWARRSDLGAAARSGHLTPDHRAGARPGYERCIRSTEQRHRHERATAMGFTESTRRTRRATGRRSSSFSAAIAPRTVSRQVASSSNHRPPGMASSASRRQSATRPLDSREKSASNRQGAPGSHTRRQ